MNNNKLSAMLQANKVWTIIAMMGYHVTMSNCEENEYLKRIEVTVFFDNKNEETAILNIILHNCIDGDKTKTKEFDNFKCIIYETTWKNE